MFNESHFNDSGSSPPVMPLGEPLPDRYPKSGWETRGRHPW